MSRPFGYLTLAVADDYLGDEMAARIGHYYECLSEAPVELEVQDRPTGNVVQQESWVEFRLRYLVHPRRSQRVRNELYRRILAAFNEHPDRVNRLGVKPRGIRLVPPVNFPVSRNQSADRKSTLKPAPRNSGT